MSTNTLNHNAESYQGPLVKQYQIINEAIQNNKNLRDIPYYVN